MENGVRSQNGITILAGSYLNDLHFTKYYWLFGSAPGSQKNNSQYKGKLVVQRIFHSQCYNILLLFSPMSADHTPDYEQIATDLAHQGYAVCDGFLNSTEVVNILQTDEFQNSKLHFRKAAVGKTNKLVNEAIRGDYIQWIDPASAPPCIGIYLDHLMQMIRYLNQSLYLSLKGVEIHRTLYPPGAHYKRHLDQFRSDDHRKLSVICYLNEQWQPKQGGQLRLHIPDGAIDILPEGGKLVCFRSDLIEHEVLPALRDRFSLTGWAVDREPGI